MQCHHHISSVRSRNIAVRQQNFHSIWADDVDALVVPATACGGSSVLSLNQRNSVLIAVAENETAINVLPE